MRTTFAFPWKPFATISVRADLGLDALDLVTIVLRLEDLEPWHGEFPVTRLESVVTVEDLVLLHESWCERDTIEMVERVSLSDFSVGT